MESKHREVNLTIDPRIISHLGEALIDNEKIALLELIKNASDADANNCNITIDTNYNSRYGRGRIVIEDDGNGMTPHIIENAFLKIATSFKAKYQKISPRFGRQAQGNKGIGRLSLNQLGRFIAVDTKVDLSLLKETKLHVDSTELLKTFGYDSIQKFYDENNEYFYHFEIDWENYDSSETTIENVKIDLKANPYEDSVFNHKKHHGTRIEVLGLKGISFWKNEQTKKEIRQDVLEFLNPFLDENVNFYVKINLDKEIFRSDSYSIENIEQGSLSTVSFSFSDTESILKINISRSREYVTFKVNTLIDELEKFDVYRIGDIPEKELLNTYSKESYTIDLSSMISIKESSPFITLNNFISYIDEKDHLEKIYLPGSFGGKIYSYNLSQKSPITIEMRNLLENIRGVKLYRNNFKIFPYGTDGNDWLGMSEYNSRQANVIYKLHSTTGFVNVDGEANLTKLRELTNRQGLVLDNYGENFLTLMKEVVYKIAAKSDDIFSDKFSFNRKKIRDMESDKEIVIEGIRFIKKENKIKIAKKNAKKIKNDKKLSEEEKKRLVNQTLNIVEDIDKDIENKLHQIKKSEEDVNSMDPIIGGSIISSTLAHEINRLTSNIKINADNTMTAIKTNRVGDAEKYIGRIKSSANFLSRYSSLLDTNSYSKRRYYSNEDLKMQVKKIIDNSPLLTYNNTTIKYYILGESFSTRMVVDSFKIIIENLLINSTYWLDYYEITNPSITFELDCDNKILYVYDNGKGINPSIENKIFEPFQTGKDDASIKRGTSISRGRGLGLYIVSNLLHELGASISLDSKRNTYGNRYKFIIKFPLGENKDE
ncbi:TPA: ATP-binding protein [Streptococcus suis]|nr:ATP-binding protein [Streptococcus suis]